MPSTSKLNYSHGDTGTKPADGEEFATGEEPDPQIFDWFWYNVTRKIDSIIGDVANIENGTTVVGEASYAQDADASTYKGNDLDSNGDGIVDESVNAQNTTGTYKGNDLDSNGDGTVDAADYANDADASTYKGNDLDSDGDGSVDAADDATNVSSTYKGNDLDSNADGVVDAADYANDANASTYKGNDLDGDGDGIVDQADLADGLTGQASSAKQLENIDPFTNIHTIAESGLIGDGDAYNAFTTYLADNDTLTITRAAFLRSDGQPAETGVDLVIATLDGTGGYTVQSTIIAGDGTNTYPDENGSLSIPVDSYTNTSGGGQTVAILADNTTTSNTDVISEATVVEN